MFPHGLRYLSLRLNQIQELGDAGHIDAYRAGGAVAAVHTVAHPADLGQSGKGGSIVPFLRRGTFIADAGIQLLQCPGAGHDGGHTGMRQSIVETLIK